MTNPVYNPRILKSLVEICAEMGVGKETIQAWISLGAPIAVEHEGGRTRYSAELAALHVWRVAMSKKGKNNGGI